MAAYARMRPELDPDGIATPQSAAQSGQSFVLTNSAGRLTFTASIKGRALWVHAAAGEGQGMAAAGLHCLEQIARANRVQSVEFQTLRMGLVRVAEKRGYRVARRQGQGYVMAKGIQ